MGRLLFDATDRSGDRSLRNRKMSPSGWWQPGKKTHKGICVATLIQRRLSEASLRYDATNVKTARWDVFFLMQRIDREIDPYGRGKCHEMVGGSPGKKTHSKGFVWLRKT